MELTWNKVRRQEDRFSQDRGEEEALEASQETGGRTPL